ncbi:MAG: hypothetical protein M3115_01995 [Thermoproteota archaeon]|nr:hypothetical protein [Thermoproteota archaeon]
MSEAFGQTIAPLPSPGGGGGGGGEGGQGQAEESILGTNASTFVVRGIIGTSLPAQNVGVSPENNNTDNNSTYVLAGRFRVVANQSIIDRFVAEMDLAAINGSTPFHNITIEDAAPSGFQLTEAGNGTDTITEAGSIPPVSSNLMTRIYVDGNTPVIDNVPLTISIRGQVLALEGINIDETRITDPAQREILGIIDGQSIYGVVSR